jgi:lambda family phage portal protein
VSLASRVKAFFTPRNSSAQITAASTRSFGNPQPSHKYGSAKYGPISFGTYANYDHYQLRERARGVYRESTIAHGLVTRIVDTVVNTGLTWESSPLWDAIPGAQQDDEERYSKTAEIEREWRIYAESTDADYSGLMTFAQLQRMAMRSFEVDGEVTAVLHYLNAADRVSPVSMQFINADQISTPYDSKLEIEAKKRGASIREGMEYDSAGRLTAIYVQDDISKPHVRVPVSGPRSGRRFVIHHANRETPGQSRGFPELDAVVYELSRLTEYDIAEMEAVVASAAWMAAIETDAGAAADPKAVKFKPNLPQAETNAATKDYGIQTVETGQFALIQNTLAPGQKMHFQAPTRPNPNFAAFIEVFESRIANSLGMPLSVYRQHFSNSYSASRAEILQWWQNVNRRRDDFISGFLKPFYEAWFTEAVRRSDIEARGYLTSARIRRAWLAGSWNGISRPNVDPLKEVNAVEKRLRLGHTTGEREAKAYNGSDFRDNVERLNTENEMLAEAIYHLEPEIVEPQEDEPEDGDTGERRRADD